MDEDERERLQAIIAYGDSTVDEDGGSADPVAQRRVLEALVSKARALGRLGRYEARIGVWDEMVYLFGDDPPPGRPLIALQAAAAKASDLLRLDRPETALEVATDVADGCASEEGSESAIRLAAHALSIKRDALARLGRQPEALGVDEQIVERFFDAEQPEIRSQVNRALLFKSLALWRADRIEDAVAVSQLMAGRVETEPEKSLPELVKIVLSDLMRLMRIGGPNPQGMAWTVLVAAINSGSVALRTTTARLGHPGSQRGRSRPSTARITAPPRSLAPAGMRMRLIRSRQRLDQALVASQAVIRQLEGTDDPELQEFDAVARIAEAMVLFVLGHPRNGARAVERMTSGEHPGAIQAWQRLAAMLAGGSPRLGKLGAASALSLRAQALAAGDRRIARIAYDDSLHDNAVTDRSIIVRLLARGLRPRPTRKGRTQRGGT